MKTHTLIRSYLPDRVVGQLGPFATLERAWRGNKPNISCIPEGSYIVKRDNFGRFRYYAVQDVPGRSGIEFHGGVYPKHSVGCILIGRNFDKQYNLLGGPEGCLEYFGEEDFKLVIRARSIGDAY